MSNARNILLAGVGAALAVAGVVATQIYNREHSPAAASRLDEAIALFHQDQYDAALPILEGIVSASSHDWRAQYYLGTTLIKLKNFKDAAVALEEAMVLNNAEADIPFALGVVYFKLGNLALAKGHFALAAELDPSNDDARGMVDAMASLELRQTTDESVEEPVDQGQR